jgi:hypothetical protein
MDAGINLPWRTVAIGKWCISLDYIKSMNLLPIFVRSNGEMIAQTGENGFHFVDEAPPAAL